MGVCIVAQSPSNFPYRDIYAGVAIWENLPSFPKSAPPSRGARPVDCVFQQAGRANRERCAPPNRAIVEIEAVDDQSEQAHFGLDREIETISIRKTASMRVVPNNGVMRGQTFDESTELGNFPFQIEMTYPGWGSDDRWTASQCGICDTGAACGGEETEFAARSA